MILSVGFAAESPDSKAVMTNLRQSGFNAIREEEFHALLNYFYDPNLQIASQLESQIAIGMETPETLRIKGIDEPAWISDPLFCHMYQIQSGSYDGQIGIRETVNYNALLLVAENHNTAAQIITDALVNKLYNALTMQSEDINPTMPLHSYGVDSLVAVELRTWFSKEMGVEVTVFDIMGSTSIAALSLLIVRRSKFLQDKVVE